MGKAAQKRMEEAIRAKREADGILEQLKANPKAALQKLGLDPNKVAEDWIYEQIEAEKMSPEQKRIRELEAEKKERELQAKKEQDERYQAEVQRRGQAYAAQFKEQFGSAIKEEGLSEDPATIYRMAELMKLNLDNYGIELTPRDAAKIWKQELMDVVKATIAPLTAEQVIAVFGDELVTKLRKYAVAQATHKAKPKAPASAPMPRQQSGKKHWQGKTEDDFFAKLDAAKNSGA